MHSNIWYLNGIPVTSIRCKLIQLINSYYLSWTYTELFVLMCLIRNLNTVVGKCINYK